MNVFRGKITRCSSSLHSHQKTICAILLWFINKPCRGILYRNVLRRIKKLSSRIDLEQHQLLCEKLVTEAINSEDRLQGQTFSNYYYNLSQKISGTIESLRNKLSLSTSLSFSEVAAPLPAIQTPDRCYKGKPIR